MEIMEIMEIMEKFRQGFQNMLSFDWDSVFGTNNLDKILANINGLIDAIFK